MPPRDDRCAGATPDSDQVPPAQAVRGRSSSPQPMLRSRTIRAAPNCDPGPDRLQDRSLFVVGQGPDASHGPSFLSGRGTTLDAKNRVLLQVMMPRSTSRRDHVVADAAITGVYELFKLSGVNCRLPGVLASRLHQVTLKRRRQVHRPALGNRLADECIVDRQVPIRSVQHDVARPILRNSGVDLASEYHGVALSPHETFDVDAVDRVCGNTSRKWGRRCARTVDRPRADSSRASLNSPGAASLLTELRTSTRATTGLS
jgi:hypothetical protein